MEEQILVYYILLGEYHTERKKAILLSILLTALDHRRHIEKELCI
jgi:hypothetical protein